MLTGLLLAAHLFGGGPCDTIPPALNRAVVAFVRAHDGQRVGRGECWDVAAEALDQAGAQWDGAYGFGTPVNPMKDCVYPGDIIRFQRATFRHYEEGVTRTEQYGDHTAVIVAVHGRGTYTLGHQNTDATGRKVGFSDIDLRHIAGGKYTVYRPTP